MAACDANTISDPSLRSRVYRRVNVKSLPWSATIVSVVLPSAVLANAAAQPFSIKIVERALNGDQDFAIQVAESNAWKKAFDKCGPQVTRRVAGMRAWKNTPDAGSVTVEISFQCGL
jgi:hypothetical protein